MSDRFYIEPGIAQIAGNTATLGGDEAHHFSRVMRGKVGDEITLFDGLGHAWKGRVQQVTKNAVSVQLLETIADTIESPLRLTVATALPKGDRQRFLIEKLAELGVSRFVPLRLDRSVARADEKTTAKFRRHVIEAAKQCGRNRLMEVTEEKSLVEFHAMLHDDVTKLILHPMSLGQVGQKTAAEFLRAGVPSQVAILVGPEGSFTEREVESALEHHFIPLELGKRILRTETACVAAAALSLTVAG